MKRVIVVSDSHGLVKPLEDIFEHFKDSVDLFIHCGDSQLSASHPIFEIYHSVKGNCDFEPFSNELLFVVDRYRIAVTHGHKHGARFGLGKLQEFGQSHDAHIVCYGHTHKPLYREEEGIVLLNPGSVRHNRGFKKIPECFALIELDETIQVTFLDVENFSVIPLI